MRLLCHSLALAGLLVTALPAQTPNQAGGAPRTRAAEARLQVRALYTKREQLIPMRDGVELFTSIYEPRERAQEVPILLCRTPYSVGPYGADEFKELVGPSEFFTRLGWIVAYQDVRGCYKSEGQFVNVRPHVPHLPDVRSTSAIDESTDAFDTIEWLVANLPGNNGKVGMWGISYPGFYAAAGMVDAHPALGAVSPQAPVADWYFDDFHHHGALFLPHAFNFLSSFGRPRPEPTTQRSGRFDHGTRDGYAFFLELGSLANVETRHFKGQIPFWTELCAHPDYDEFWQERNLLPDLKRVAPAVMTVGGWYDAENLYGALNVYRAVEQQNPGVSNVLVMGPWAHGGWARGDGDRLGGERFGAMTSAFYRENIELPFFQRHLLDQPAAELPEAYVFETGANRWRTFADWPPPELVQRVLWFQGGERLSFDPAPAAGVHEFVSDPAEPVPYTEAVAIGMTREYMTDDQRFAARRPDVLAYRSEVLTEDLTLAGPLEAELWVTTTGTDADWIVKLIDVLPKDARSPEDLAPGQSWSECQRLVRSEVLRGRYRDSYSTPEPFTPGQPTRVRVPLQDVLHTFKAGHRVMVQVQSTWFPLVDRNPQTFVPNIFLAKETDFVKATHRILHGGTQASGLRIQVLPR